MNDFAMCLNEHAIYFAQRCDNPIKQRAQTQMFLNCCNFKNLLEKANEKQKKN